MLGTNKQSIGETISFYFLFLTTLFDTRRSVSQTTRAALC